MGDSHGMWGVPKDPTHTMSSTLCLISSPCPGYIAVGACISSDCRSAYLAFCFTELTWLSVGLLGSVLPTDTADPASSAWPLQRQWGKSRRMAKQEAPGPAKKAKHSPEDSERLHSLEKAKSSLRERAQCTTLIIYTWAHFPWIIIDYYPANYSAWY